MRLHEWGTRGMGKFDVWATRRLEVLLLEGLNGGRDIPVTDSFWKELKSAAGKILAKHKKSRKARSAR